MQNSIPLCRCAWFVIYSPNATHLDCFLVGDVTNEGLDVEPEPHTCQENTLPPHKPRPHHILMQLLRQLCNWWELWEYLIFNPFLKFYLFYSMEVRIIAKKGSCWSLISSELGQHYLTFSDAPKSKFGCKWAEAFQLPQTTCRLFLHCNEATVSTSKENICFLIIILFS